MASWARLIAALGGSFVVLGAGRAILLVIEGGAVSGALVDVILIGIPGFVVLYGGYRLPKTDLHPDAYPRIASWSLGGAGLMLGVVLLLVLNPAGSVDRPIRAVIIATALGTVAGLAIGTNEARAITQAREAEHHAAEAERGREILGFLNSTLRHEVLNGINIIQGQAAQLANELDVGTNSHIDIIEARSGDLADLINDIRPMARTLTGEAETTAIDLSATLIERVNAIRATYPSATVTTEVPADVSVQANQGISHALSNILVNAIEHNDQDAPRVEVSVTPAAERVRIDIADNGPGLDETVKEHIFKEETELNRGFGLYMTETLVSHFGGELQVEDNDPRGAVFTIELPRASLNQ